MTRTIDYSQFFELEDPGASRPLRLDPQEELSRQSSFELYKAELRPAKPVLLKAFMGGEPVDFLWTSMVYMVCISHRVLRLLQENGFTGWATYPVEVYGRRGEPLPGYHGFAVKSWVGKIDLRRSRIVNKPPRVPGADAYEVYKGLYFDETRWDGSDVFRLGAGDTVVAKRVRDAFKQARVTNVRLTPLNEYEIDVTYFDESNKEYWSA